MFLGITIGLALSASVFAGWLLSRVSESEEGTPEMSEFSKAAEVVFLEALKKQALVLGQAALAAGALVYLVLAFFTFKGQAGAVQTGFAFLAGVLFQALAGFAAARIFFRSALKTAAAVKRSGAEAFTLALWSAGASAVITLALSLAGVTALFLLVGGWDAARNAPLKIAGFCFGSVFAALFSRLAGGLYSEAACALDSAVPENAGAVLAGNSARNAVNLGADIFDSAAAENLAAMALGAALWPVYGSKAIVFPLFARACGLAACTAGVMRAGSSGEGGHMDALDKGFAAAGVTALAGLFLGCSLGLDGNMWLFMATVIGVVSAVLFTSAARYYGGHRHRPARMVAKAASGGAAAALIRALSSGFESVAAPVALVAAAVMGSYYCGVRGLESCCASGWLTERTCGLYGVAAAIVGMMSVSGYILGLGVFGAVSGGAQVINDMTHQEETVRLDTGILAAAGRTALAAAAGYSGAAAVLASVLLFFAYMLKTSGLISRPFETVDFAGAEGLAGGLLGAMLVFLFCAYCLRACAALRTEDGASVEPAALSNFVLKRLIIPAALVIGLPLASVLIFRRSGLSPEVLSAMLISVVGSGALMSAFIRNTAASLENSLIFMEETGSSGPGAEGHKAASEACSSGVVLKDTVAPALNALIKFLPAMALVLAELFV
ncbi:MAG: hypothetical protein A2270_00280 [Elusimicrobia bacterium RIFOXYA12_FULL_51_18]|nr:MAG: hypothetical protein A2270_00280 [Elusimicrobia bacterium RIFOXYA12_FULL_51_18]OGS31532.1 MAG: hypothetical protein A2218_09750 [Elusimicrobia bacterium RIFOXYA2_FULL_53_38]